MDQTAQGKLHHCFLTGLLRPSNGAFCLMGMTCSIPYKVVDLGISMVMEEGFCMTVMENLNWGLRTRARKQRRTVDHVLKFSGLKNAWPGWHVERWKRQMLAIGRAMMSRTKL